MAGEDIDGLGYAHLADPPLVLERERTDDAHDDCRRHRPCEEDKATGLLRAKLALRRSPHDLLASATAA
jgi:hypothetical protein